jgi:hypothetical protein
VQRGTGTKTQGALAQTAEHQVAGAKGSLTAGGNETKEETKKERMDWSTSPSSTFSYVFGKLHFK